MKKIYSQEEIIEALKKKDRKVWRFLFTEYFERMVLFAEYFLLDRGEAEDVVQETFMQLWRCPELPVIHTHFKAYLFAQVRNRCLNRIKHLHVEDAHKEWLMEAQIYAEIPEVELDEEVVQKIYAAIDELPEQARQIFKRCVIDGLKYKEVALEMGITVNTVNTQMKRAYKYLRQRLGHILILFIISF